MRIKLSDAAVVALAVTATCTSHLYVINAMYSALQELRTPTGFAFSCDTGHTTINKVLNQYHPDTIPAWVQP